MDRIYLDHAATTPVRGEVRDAMEPFLSETFGNPSSLHSVGRAARAAVEEARDRVATALGADFEEIVFVRGGTESDNLAVLGRADAVRLRGQPPLLVVSAVEHRAVLASARSVIDHGGEVVVLPVEPTGRIDDDVLSAAIGRGPDLVSMMWVNNETGLRLPVEAVAERCREAGVPFHTDAVQAVGQFEVRVDATAVDLLTATGHKIYGPKGTGILYRRDGVELRPRIFGGGQEEGIRPGTHDVAGAVGMATALELAVAERDAAAERLGELRDRLERRIVSALPEARIHSAEGPRAPHILNVGFPGADLEALMVGLDLEGLSVSSGSACSSGSVTTSHVLEALYGQEAEGVAPIRFSLGRDTTEVEIEEAAERTARTVERVRSVAA